MATSYHYQADDDLAKGSKHATQRCADGWVAKAQANIATEDLKSVICLVTGHGEHLLRRGDFKEDRKDGKGLAAIR